jgi:hypothetical protein
MGYLTHDPNLTEAHGQRLGPAHDLVYLFSAKRTKEGRPAGKAKKEKAKKPNLFPSFHP